MPRSHLHLPLPRGKKILTIRGMSELIWIAFLILCWYAFSLVHRHWKRKKKAAKLADDLLHDVLKQKDGFRR